MELNATRITAKTLATQLKLSRCAEDEECSTHAVLRNRVEISQAPKRKVLTSIREDMRAVSRDTELFRFRLTMTHRGLESEFVRNPRILGAEYRVRFELSRERSVS